MKKAFVTGGSGFIGNYLVRELVDEGHDVLCLKRPTSDLRNLGDYRSKVTWVDTSDNWQEDLLRFAPDIVFNLAWNGVSAAERSDWTAQLSNITLQQELLQLAAQSGCAKFVGTGSQSEYGAFEHKVDELYPVDPKTPYAAVKVASMHLLKCYCELYGMEWYWFRLFPLFGPYESERWLIPSLIKNICTEQYMDLTPGAQKLAYLYVGECARAIASVIDAEGKSGIYNVCADNPISLKSLVMAIRDKVNPKFQLNFGALPYRQGQCMYMEGDTTALCQNLYQLHTENFQQRLDDTIDYYVNKYKNA